MELQIQSFRLIFMSHWSSRSGFENVFHSHSWIHHHLRIKILSFDLLSALDVHSIEEKIKKFNSGPSLQTYD